MYFGKMWVNKFGAGFNVNISFYDVWVSLTVLSATGSLFEIFSFQYHRGTTSDRKCGGCEFDPQ